MPQEPFRILVVDDEPLNLQLIAEYLSDPRYRVRGVSDGAQAWDALQHDGVAYDLVVLDRAMPGMDGMELLGHIKGDRRFADMPVIMQTAVAQPQDVLHGVSQGAYYYLTKPYDHDMLVAVVDAAINFRSRQKQLKRRLSDVNDVFQNLHDARFVFSTLTEARQLASFLARLCPVPEIAVIGLAELMINAVEHGNLELGHEAKGRLSLEGTWAAELERRAALPEYRDRVACVTFERKPDRLVFHVSDDGPGFDWASFLATQSERELEHHGRGIAMAATLSFDALIYLQGGREAVGTILLTGGRSAAGRH